MVMPADVVQSSTPPRKFADRLGGRWALSIPGHVIAFVIAVVGMSGDLVRLGRSDAVVILGAIVMAFCVNAVVDVVLHRSRWSNRRLHPIPAPEVLVRLIVAGVTIASLFVAARQWLDVDVAVGSWQGFLVYPIVSVWIGSTVIVYLDVIDQARSIRQRAVVERSTALELAQRAGELGRDLRARVAAILDPELMRVRLTVDESDPAGAASELRNVAEQSVRPLSRELWRHGDGEPRRITVGELMRTLVLRPTFRPWSIIGISVVLPLASNPAFAKPMLFTIGLLAAGMIFVECWVANWIMMKHPASHPLVVAATVAVFVAQAWIVEVEGGRWGRPRSEIGLGGVIIGTAVLVVVTSALGSYRDLNDRRARVLADQIRADRLDAAAHAHLVAEQSRQLARMLHGAVQSRLLGCAMALELAGSDPTLMSEAMERTRAVLSSRWGESSDEAEDPFARILSAWSGVATLEMRGVHAVPGSAACAVAAVVEELAANAIRHGRANRVGVFIEVDADQCTITSVDNGVGGGSSEAVGLGTHLIAELGVVHRLPGPNGWTVSVSIPI